MIRILPPGGAPKMWDKERERRKGTRRGRWGDDRGAFSLLPDMSLWCQDVMQTSYHNNSARSQRVNTTTTTPSYNESGLFTATQRRWYVVTWTAGRSGVPSSRWPSSCSCTLLIYGEILGHRIKTGLRICVFFLFFVAGFKANKNIFLCLRTLITQKIVSYWLFIE